MTIMRFPIKPSQKLILMYLDMAGPVKIAARALADEINISARSVQRHLEQLETRGLVIKKNTHSETGMIDKNHYTINF